MYEQQGALSMHCILLRLRKGTGLVVASIRRALAFCGAGKALRAPDAPASSAHRENGTLDFRPRLGKWIDQIEVLDLGQQLQFAGIALRDCGGVMTNTDLERHRGVGGSVDQRLRDADRKQGGWRRDRNKILAIDSGPTQEGVDSASAKLQFGAALQIECTREGDGAPEGKRRFTPKWLAGRETMECRHPNGQVSARREPHRHDPRQVQPVFRRDLAQEIDRRADVLQSSRVSPAPLSHAPVFDIPSRHPRGAQRRRQMRVCPQVMLCPPPTAVNTDDYRKWPLARGKPQIGKLP